MDGQTLLNYIDKQKKTKIGIAKDLGISKQSLFQYFKSKALEPETKKKFEDYFGESIFTNKPTYTEQRRNQKLQPKRKEIPFFDADAEAGALTETEMTPIHAPAGTIDVGDLLSDSVAALRIYGNSMNPNYPPGCVVGLLPYLDSSIEPGEVYVIETKSARRLKRLFYKDDEPESEYLLCYSDNTMKFEGGARDGKLAYPPYYIHKSEIVHLFAVSGVIKRNMNSVIINR